MARLEHLNLVVRDLQPTIDFLLTAFPHWRVRGGGDSEWYGAPRKWAHVGDDASYLTINDSGTGSARDLKSNTRGLSHIGFAVANLDDVVGRLVDAGYEITHAGNHTTWRRNVYFHDGEGLEFEFTEYLSDDPEKRNEYV